MPKLAFSYFFSEDSGVSRNNVLQLKEKYKKDNHLYGKNESKTSRLLSA